MSRRENIAWDEIRDLRVFRALFGIAATRWGMGIGLLTPDGEALELPEAAVGVRERVAAHAAAVRQIRAAASGPADASGVPEGIHRRTPTGAASQVYERASLEEVAAPIVVAGRCAGWVTVGGYVRAPGGAGSPVAAAVETVPVLDDTEVAFLRQLLETLAREISTFQTEMGRFERRLDRRLAAPGPQREEYAGIVGRSRPMQRLYVLLDKVVASDATVLIQGEGGTGKELVARAVHARSARRERAFVVQNCAAFNDNLLESELFGHRRGAFTGAVHDKRGLFDIADGGTFFLDEIGEMSAALQVKLLRVLQEGTFTPVGDTQVRTVDVRIVAATNRDLVELRDSGSFREDLFYRINVVNVALPPLRERKEDIPMLVDYFLQRYVRATPNPSRGKRLSRACLDRLMRHDWPGNVRELENEIERLVVLAGDDNVIGGDLLSDRFERASLSLPAVDAAGGRCLPAAVERLERTMIYEVLKRNDWNKTRAARELKISRRNLIRKVSKYGLEQRGR